MMSLASQTSPYAPRPMQRTKSWSGIAGLPACGAAPGARPLGPSWAPCGTGSSDVAASGELAGAGVGAPEVTLESFSSSTSFSWYTRFVFARNDQPSAQGICTAQMLSQGNQKWNLQTSRHPIAATLSEPASPKAA